MNIVFPIPASSNLLVKLACLPVFLILLVSACTTPGKKEDQGPLFYPALPNPPRIQYLVSFSKLRDIQQLDSGFANFVLGERSDDADLVTKPYGAAIFEGKIYVVDTRGPGFGILDLKNRNYELVSGTGPGKMKKPINITIDKDGTKYVCDTSRKQILVYDRLNKFIKAMGIDGQFKPGDVAIHKNNLYVADLEHHQIHVLDKHNGTTIRKFGKVGSKAGELYFPTNLAIGRDDRIFVSDTGNYRIQEYTLAGKFVASHGSVGAGPGQFARPKGVAVDRDGRLFVVDAAFGNIQMFNKDNKLLLYFSGAGDISGKNTLLTVAKIDYENVQLFQKYAEPDFKLEYVILVVNQFGQDKVNVFGFGKMEGFEYLEDEILPKK